MIFENLSPHYEEIQAVAGSALSAGDFETVEDVNGFPIVDIANGATHTMITKSAKVRATKIAGVAIKAGEAVYYITATTNVTNIATANTLIGYANEAAASADTDIVITFDGNAAFLKA